MHAELVVPGLFAAAQGVRMPAAELLLARGRRSGSERRSVEHWLQEAFELEGGLPAGALTVLARGELASGFLARADPVHLRLPENVTAIKVDCVAPFDISAFFLSGKNRIVFEDGGFFFDAMRVNP